MMKEMQDLKNKIVNMIIDKTETFVREHDEDSVRHLMSDFDDLVEVFTAASEDFGCIHGLYEHLSKSGRLSPKESTLIEVFLYLLVAEGSICNFLNFVSYLLVMTGHDLYSLTKRKYMKANMKEIRKVEMSTKIQFLKHHGFGILTKEYDSTFRNDIAHHNYKVDEKGVIWIRGESVSLESKLRPVSKILSFAEDSTNESREELANLFSRMMKTHEKL